MGERAAGVLCETGPELRERLACLRSFAPIAHQRAMTMRERLACLHHIRALRRGAAAAIVQGDARSPPSITLLELGARSWHSQRFVGCCRWSRPSPHTATPSSQTQSMWVWGGKLAQHSVPGPDQRVWTVNVQLRGNEHGTVHGEP